MSVPSEIRLLSRYQVAEMLDISTRTLDRLTKEGQLPVVQIDRRPRYLLSDVETFIAARRTANS